MNLKPYARRVGTDGRVMQGGVSIGAGAGAASALHSVLSRVVCARGAAGAHAALRMVCAVWRSGAGEAAEAGAAYDLQATLLRVAHPMLQVLSGRYTHHAVSLLDTVGESTRRHAARCVGGWPYVPDFEAAAFASAAYLSASWIREGTGARSDNGSEARLSGLLADVLSGGGGGASRRAPLRRSVLVQLLHYCRKLLAVPIGHQNNPTQVC